MPTPDEVMAVLARVDDPVLNRPITDLEMVEGVEVDGADVVVRVRLPTEGYPMASALEVDITRVVSALPGVHGVAVEYNSMGDEERGRLRERLENRGSGRSALQDPASRTRILAVASGKGGVGKSSVTVNLAVQIARMGKRTALIDADVWGFSVPRMMGVQRPPSLIDNMIIPPVSHGVSIVSMGFFVSEHQPVIWRGPMLHKALEQFLTDVWWDEPDYLLIDMPPGTGDISISMAQYLPRSEVIVVTTPQVAAQKVAQRAAAMARKVNLTVLGVVENMSWFTGDDGARYEIFGAGGGRQLAAELEVPLLGRVPLDPRLREGGDAGVPISVADPASEAAVEFEAIARRIEELGPKKRRSSKLTVRPA